MIVRHVLANSPMNGRDTAEPSGRAGMIEQIKRCVRHGLCIVGRHKQPGVVVANNFKVPA